MTAAVVDRDRRVQKGRRGRVAVVERRRVHKRLERGARLTLGLRRSVEFRFVERKSADHRQYAARKGIHGDAGAGHFRDLTQAIFAFAARNRLDVEDVARLDQALYSTARPARAFDRDRACPTIGDDRARFISFGLKTNPARPYC